MAYSDPYSRSLQPAVRQNNPYNPYSDSELAKNGFRATVQTPAALQGNGGQAGNAGAQPRRGLTDQQIAQGIGGLGAVAGAMTTKSTDPMDFSVDPWAGYTGSAAGFGSSGLVGAIVGGATAQLETFNKVHSSLDKLNTGVTVMDTDAMGRPIYSSQSVLNAAATDKALREGQKAIDTSLDPATHVISWIRGTGREIKRGRRRLRENTQSAQADFSKRAAANNQMELALAQYNRTNDKGRRLQSLYNIGNQPLY